jgi:hypothetical protein
MVKDSVDEQYFEAVETVFDEEKGSPFWREILEEELSFDPREVESAEEGLQKLEDELGFISSDTIRNTPLRRLTPESYDPGDGQEFASGGRTSSPKWIAYSDEVNDFFTEEKFVDELDEREVPEGSDWIYIGPSGPHLIGTMSEAAKERGEMFFDIDLDPRWVRKTRDEGMKDAGKAYQQHIKGQVQDIVSTQYEANDDWIMFSTPVLIEQMAETGQLEELDPSAVMMAGTPIEPENLRYLDEQVLPDSEVMMLYGNTMAGGSIGEIQEDGTVEYPSPEPVTLYEVRDPENPEETVDYGEEGRLLLHRLTPEYFLPNFLEDDAVTRHESRDGYEWDWVGNPHIPEEEQEDIETGVY